FLSIRMVDSKPPLPNVSEYEMSDIDSHLLREVKKVAKEAAKERITKGKMAERIKSFLDIKSGGDSVWCCIVGSQFGGDVTYQSGTGATFFVGETIIMIFRPK
ncbi:hypothetical protein PFISCL1PPCAC_2397, partial [Pristionchus fissidentatus]